MLNTAAKQSPGKDANTVMLMTEGAEKKDGEEKEIEREERTAGSVTQELFLCTLPAQEGGPVSEAAPENKRMVLKTWNMSADAHQRRLTAPCLPTHTHTLL
ncbi:unnamed protein product [Pleuronectes platessa]|uniref:Uncharacterized protein n=1 Tax=Pleuronectes platessa TaxID=8262 RepID=A0A9N7YXD1_PLEPL|nr:unnamed protein product [Pleuronectes platessa]